MSSGAVVPLSFEWEGLTLAGALHLPGAEERTTGGGTFAPGYLDLLGDWALHALG